MTEILKQSTFSLPKMDCSSEESLMRMALSGKPAVHTLAFDLAARELKVLHTGPSSRCSPRCGR